MSYINNDLKNNEKYYKKYLKYKNKYHDTAIKQGGSMSLLYPYLPTVATAVPFGTGIAAGYLMPKILNKILSKKSNSIEETKHNEEYISLDLSVECAYELLSKVKDSYKISMSDMLTLLIGNYSVNPQPHKQLFTIVFKKMSKDHLQIVNINNTEITATTKESTILTLINKSDPKKSMPLYNKPPR